MSWPSGTGWRWSSRRPAVGPCSTTAGGWVIRRSAGGSSRRPSGRAGSRGSTRSSSATPTRTISTACPTCSTDSPSGRSASRPDSAGRPTPRPTGCSPRSARAASGSERPQRPSRGRPAECTLRLNTRPLAGIPRPPTTPRSLVLDVAYAGRHLLLTGDLEQLGLIELIAHPRPDPPPDVMLAPHHGGRSANPVSLYEWAGPVAVVVSQRAPRRGTSDALTSLDRTHVPLWRTWRDGAIRLRWTDRGIVASGFLARDDPPAAGPTDRGGSAWSASRPLPFAMVGPGSWTLSVRLAIGLGGFAIGVMLWAIMAIVEFGAWTLVVPPRSGQRRNRHGEDNMTMPDRAMVPEPIEVRTDDGVRLAGRWYPAPVSVPPRERSSCSTASPRTPRPGRRAARVDPESPRLECCGPGLSRLRPERGPLCLVRRTRGRRHPGLARRDRRTSGRPRAGGAVLCRPLGPLDGRGDRDEGRHR